MRTLRAGLAPILLSLGFLFAAPAQAVALELGLGYVDEIEGASSSSLSLNVLTRATHPWEFMAGYLASRGRESRVPSPDVFFVSASKRFTWRGWFVQGGIAWTDSDTEVLSRNWQFVTGGGYRFNERWSLSLRHLSNANTGGRNRGENLLVLHYGF